MAVVTGASSGIGAATARALAAQGFEVVCVARRVDRIEALAAQIDGRAVRGDVTSATDVASLVEQVGGRCDLLVNNAGVYPSGFLLDIDAAEWDRIMDLNVRVPFLLTQLVAKQIIAAGRGGAVVNISSGAAHRMRRSVVPYCLSKTALDRLTKGYALELAQFGIRVNAVEPGFAAGSTSSPLTDEHVRQTLAGIPLGRASGPEDAAAAVLFLCSPAASYITGTSVAVDGGNSIGSLAVHQAKKTPL